MLGTGASNSERTYGRCHGSRAGKRRFYDNRATCICENIENDPSSARENNSNDDSTKTVEVIDIESGGDSLVR